MGTIWSMDKTTIDQMGAVGAGFLGVMPYRYSFEPGKTAAFAAMEEVGSKKPGSPWRTLFYTNGWMTASVRTGHSRTLAAKKESPART